MLPLTTHAEPDAEDQREEYVRDFDTITVVAHRQPRSLSEVAGTVTVIGREHMERDMVVDIADLVRYEPGVEVDSGSTRFGFNGFRIRGIGGNRTAVIIDNVPAPDRFTVGSFSDTGRGLMELGLAERVEILRGPASTLYGSKALGGVVAVSLIDVDDLLPGDGSAHRMTTAGGTDSDRMRVTSTTALRAGNRSLILAAAGQRGGEVNVAKRPQDLPRDELDRRHGGVLLRGGLDTAVGRFRLSLDGLRETRDSDLHAILGHERFVDTTSLKGDDRRHQWRLILDHHFEGAGVASRGHWRAWHQQSDTRQETTEQRLLAPTPVELFRRFEFTQDMTGVGADLESEFSILGLDHRLGYGLELTRADITTQRDAMQTTLETGQSARFVLGEQFPLRDFPASRVTELGVYLHDEISLWHRGPRLSPGIRFEYYDLSVRNDPLFEARFPDAQTTSLSTTSWLPRLGLVWPINDSMELFAQYARGFRAPPFEDVNIGLEIPMFNIRAIANPDLEPERGRTAEAGLRWRGSDARAELAVIRNDYRDFIQTRAPIGFDPASGFLEFQSINRDSVRIEGVEARYQQQLGRNLTAELAAEWTRGRDRVDERPLPEVSPPRLISELAWLSPSTDWETRLIVSAVKSQRELRDEQGDALFSTPGHATVDLLTRYFPRQDLSVGVGLFNLTDRQYWRNAAVPGRAPDDPLLPLLAEPGRSLMVTLTWQSR
ncbi:TonB-dependent receptor [Wenzhouxiangella sp. AB-CW3]|nr:TonB-dependent receptor [Wenzhouxiangella sp. AB-CW3]